MKTITPYVNSPLPTPEDRLLFLLTYLNVALLQVAADSFATGGNASLAQAQSHD